VVETIGIRHQLYDCQNQESKYGKQIKITVTVSIKLDGQTEKTLKTMDGEDNSEDHSEMISSHQCS